MASNRTPAEFPFYAMSVSEFGNSIFVKHFSEKVCIVVDTWETQPQIRVVRLEQLTTPAWDEYLAGTFQACTKQRFDLERQSTISLLLNF